MRRSSLISRIAAFLAILVLPLAIASAWLEATVTDTDRYVATVAPLAEDPVVLAAVETELTKATLQAIDLDRREREIQALVDQGRLTPGLQDLLAEYAGPVREAITLAVEEATTRVVYSPEFPDAWSQANRSAHQELTAALTGEGSTVVDGDGRISIQLDTLLTTIFGLLNAEGIVDETQIPDLEASFTFMQTDDLQKVKRAYTWLDRLGFWLPVLWVLLVAVALLLAKNRRRVLRWLAIGGLVGLAALVVGLRIGRDQVVGADGVGDPTVVAAVWDIVVATLKTTLWVSAAVALTLLVISWLPRRARQPR